VWVPTVFTTNRERLLKAEVAHKFLAELLNHKDKSFRAKDGSDEPPSGGRNGERERLSTFCQTVPIDNEGGFIPGVYPEDLPDADPEKTRSRRLKRFFKMLRTER
jgi:hypothetical protein